MTGQTGDGGDGGGADVIKFPLHQLFWFDNEGRRAQQHQWSVAQITSVYDKDRSNQREVTVLEGPSKHMVTLLDDVTKFTRARYARQLLTAEEEKEFNERNGGSGRQSKAAPPSRLLGPAKDRANQEVFIRQNGEANLDFFPSESACNEFLKHHLPSLMSTTHRDSTTIQEFYNTKLKMQFWGLK